MVRTVLLRRPKSEVFDLVVRSVMKDVMNVRALGNLAVMILPNRAVKPLPFSLKIEPAKVVACSVEFLCGVIDDDDSHDGCLLVVGAAMLI
jgi:hypothetical protein